MKAYWEFNPPKKETTVFACVFINDDEQFALQQKWVANLLRKVFVWPSIGLLTVFNDPQQEMLGVTDNDKRNWNSASLFNWGIQSLLSGYGEECKSWIRSFLYFS